MKKIGLLNDLKAKSSQTDRRQRSYTVSEKIKLLNDLKTKFNNNLSAMERKTGITRSVLRGFRDNEAKLTTASHKQTSRRLPGGGRKAQFPQLESVLYKWVQTERQAKRNVSWTRLRRQGKAIAAELGITFTGSDKWIHGFMKRSKLALRVVTHVAQQNTQTPMERAETARLHLSNTVMATEGIPAGQIYNMDEVPCYIDMASTRTITFKGDRTVDSIDTGHGKTRFTTVLCVGMGGQMTKAMIILKGLKNLPKVKVPKNIHLATSMSGSMNETLMHQWIDRVFCGRGPFSLCAKSLLFMDQFGSHKHDSVLQKLKAMKTEVLFIPTGTTSYFQPLDVAVNASFKSALREQWEYWLSEGEHQFTPKGNRKRPSWQQIVNFVSASIEKLDKSSFKRAFECCGVGERGQQLQENILNHRLSQILAHHESQDEMDFENEQLDEEETLSVHGASDVDSCEADHDNENELV